MMAQQRSDDAKAEVQKQVKEMLQHGIIKRCSNIQWKASTFTVSKNTDEVRVVVDYRNQTTPSSEMQNTTDTQ